MADDKFKLLITDSLDWLHKQRRCAIYGFVIMPNHIHLLWRMNNNCGRPDVQGALLSYTAHRFKEELRAAGEPALMKHFVGDADRTFQFWERDSLVKECWSEAFMTQKLEYIHRNPCQPKWRLAETPEDYKWSSAAFYQSGRSDFSWLTHYAS